jgi:hypothetical protein
MGKKAPKAPKPIDPNVVGPIQEASIDRSVATGPYSQDKINRPTTRNQYGTSVNWTTGPDGRAVQTTTLGGQGQQFAGLLSGLGKQYFNEVNNRPDDLTSQGAFDQADQFWQQREEPRLERQRAALDNRLKNQGFDQSAEGYKSAMDDLSRQQGDQRAGFLNSAQSQFFNQGQQARLAELNELAPGMQYAGQTISAGQTPFSNLSIPTVDYAQLYGMKQDQLNKNYAQEMAQYNAGLGGLFSTVGNVLTTPFGGAGTSLLNRGMTRLFG